MMVPSGSSPGRVGTEVTMSASALGSVIGFGFAASTAGDAQGSGSPIIRSSELQGGLGAVGTLGTEVAVAGAAAGAGVGAGCAAGGLVAKVALGVAVAAVSLVIVSSGGGCETPEYELGFCGV